MTLCPAVFDRDVATLDIGSFVEPSPDSVELASFTVRAAEQTNHRHRQLLRARSERPCNRRAADERDELAPFQLIELHSIPASQGRIVRYRIGEEVTELFYNLLAVGEGGRSPTRTWNNLGWYGPIMLRLMSSPQTTALALRARPG